MMAMSKNQQPTDLGPVEFWMQLKKIWAPLYSMTAFTSSQKIPVTDMAGRYSWQVPELNDMPRIVRDVEPTNTQKGRGGTLFKIALNRKAYGLNAILTYDKFSGMEFIVTDIQDYSDNEFIYICRLVNGNSDLFLPNDVLIPQTPIFRMGSAKGEYSENYDSINTKASYREYYNYTATAEANFEMSISDRAQYIMHSKAAAGTKGLPIQEVWKFDPETSKDVSTYGVDPILNKLGSTEVMKRIQDGTIWYGFCTQLELQGQKKIAADIENYGMWGKGGKISMPDGRDDARLPVGIWRQLDNAYKRAYNVGVSILPILENQIKNFFNGRVDFVGPDPERKLIIQTGMGGMQQAMAEIKKMANSSGLVQNASEIGAISGKAMSLDFGYAFQSYVIPFLANVKFQLNPALDAVEANERENPMLNGYRLSSYAYIIMDVTNNLSDNIFQLENTNLNPAFKWRYVNGTADYMMRTSGFQSSGNFSGFKLYMTQLMKTFWIKDPTKVLKVVPINPITKLPFGSFSY
jgi:hypothetical protein